MAARDVESPTTPGYGSASPTTSLAEISETGDEVRIAKLTMAESIYSYIVLYPEVTRVQHGTYLTSKVFIAFAMIAMNLTAQISLTLITGETILEEADSYKTALLGSDQQMIRVADADKFTVPHVDDPSNNSMTRKIQDTAAQGITNITDTVLGREAEAEVCCLGVSCAGMAACCIPGAAAKTPNSTNLLAHGKPGGGGRKVVQKKDGEELDEKPKRSLCGNWGNMLDCSPPTFSFIDAWEYLDTNKDGFWSKKEAHADEANIGCRLAIDPAIVLQAVLRGTAKYAKEFRNGSLTSEIKDRKGVSKAYYDHWVGTLALCSAVDPDRCPELIKQGIYNGALQVAATGSRSPMDGITSLNEALDHCQTMLQDGGICEKALPVTYKIYREQVRSKCGTPSLTSGKMFANPFDHEDVMRAVDVSYSNLDKYQMAEGFTFQFFVSIILLIWYLALLGEAIALCNMADFIWNFPAADDADPLHIRQAARKLKKKTSEALSRITSRGGSDEESAQEPLGRQRSPTPKANPEARHIDAICTEHRILCTAILIVRTWLMVYMAIVGTIFLQNTYSYPDLLMNAVALAFVFELPEFLYNLLVSQEDKEVLEHVGDLEFRTSVPEPNGIWGYLLEINFYGLVLFPLFCVMTCACHFYYTVQPVFEALNCACLQNGDRCRSEQVLTESWWMRQWALPVPY